MVRERNASERQIAFLNELARERVAPTEALERLSAALSRGTLSASQADLSIKWFLRQPVRPGVVPSRIAAMPKREVNLPSEDDEARWTREIQQRERDEDHRVAAFKMNRDRIEAALNPPQRTRPSGSVAAQVGVYVKDGEIYVVKVSTRNEGRRYAVRLVVSPPRVTENGEEVDFSYVRAPGMVFALTENDRMPEADMKDFMIKYRKCIRCGHGLKAAKTIKRSEALGVMVGKTCAKKMGLI